MEGWSHILELSLKTSRLSALGESLSRKIKSIWGAKTTQYFCQKRWKKAAWKRFYLVISYITKFFIVLDRDREENTHREALNCPTLSLAQPSLASAFLWMLLTYFPWSFPALPFLFHSHAFPLWIEIVYRFPISEPLYDHTGYLHVQSRFGEYQNISFSHARTLTYLQNLCHCPLHRSQITLNLEF